MNGKYRNISIKTEFANAIEAFIKEHPQYAYRSIAQFLEDSGRERLESLRGLPIKLPTGYLEYINCDETGVKIHDKKLREVVQLFFRREGVFCKQDEAEDCIHIRFALTIPEVKKVVHKRRKQGWNLPDP